MLIELAVLGSQHGALHVKGYVGEGDTAPSGVTEAADLGGAVGVVDDRGLGAGHFIGIGHRREDDRRRERPRSKQAEEEQREEGAPDPASLAARLTLGRTFRVPAALGCHGAPPAFDGLP